MGASAVGELSRSKDKVKLYTHSNCLHFVMIMLKSYLFYYYSHKAIINKFLEGDEIMEKLHCMVKIFSSTISNRKNYEYVLDDHRCLPTNQLKKDHNVTRIIHVNVLLKSALRTNTGAFVFLQSV